MNNFQKIVFPGKYIQGKHSLESELPKLISGLKTIIIVTKSAVSGCMKDLIPLLDKEKVQVVVFEGECCLVEIDRLSSLAKRNKAECIVAVGGGKVIDTAKCVADSNDCKCIIVPTIASTDAATSALAVIYKDGVMAEVKFQRNNPDVVLVDTAVISKAPIRFLVSGMGDALATYMECRSCYSNHQPNCVNALSTHASVALAKLCFDILIHSGVQAVNDLKAEQAKPAGSPIVVSDAINSIIEANTLLSGIGFESGGLACAHSLHNGLTVLPQTHSFWHGEKVAFGACVGLHFNASTAGAANNNSNSESKLEMATVYSFCESVGLPTTLAQIGLANISKEELMSVAAKTCEQGENIWHESGEIAPERVCEAILAADKMGRERMSR